MLQSILHLLVAHLIELFMLSVGLRIQPRTVVRAARERPWLYGRALLVLFVGVPLLTLVIAKLLSLPPRMAGLLVVFGVCPAAPLVVPRLLRKNERAGTIALTLVVLASLLAPVLVPTWLAILNPLLGSSLEVAPGTLLGIFVGKLLVPLAVGVLVRRASPRIAEKLAPVFGGVATLALAIAVVLLLKASFDTLRHLTPLAVLALLLTAFGSGALGELAAGEAPDDRDAVATVAMTGSPALALAIIHASYPGLTNVTGLVGTYLILRVLVGIPYRVLAARRRRAGARPAEAHA